MGMAEELERAQLGVNWKGVGAGHLCMLMMLFWWQTWGELQAMLDVVEPYVSRWMMKFNRRKSIVMVVGKRDAGVSWKIGEEIVEEVEEFKYLGVWVERKLRGNVELEKMAKKGRRVDWEGDMDEQSVWAGGNR